MSTVIDPICGRRLDASTAAATSRHEGQTFYFHSLECQRVFDASPDAYLGPGGAAGRRTTPHGFDEAPFRAPKFGAAGSGGGEYEEVPEFDDVEDADDVDDRDD